MSGWPLAFTIVGTALTVLVGFPLVLSVLERNDKDKED